MASGLSVGLAMGVGGVAAVVLGAVADAVDLKTALTICAIAPALGVVACLRLPAPAARPRQRPASAGTLEPTAYARE
jgi:FSR family fosmidomycin resistance protein-like MFS transporter